jgi:uncharacterized protein (DUF58 family)
MLTPEILHKIHLIELRTRRLVKDSFAGSYHSVFKGRGIAFDAVRPYQPGDDVRDIDWNVTARAGEAYVKQYIEERELTVMLVLDSSASCLFGTVNRQKRDLAAELGAVLALSAITNNDRVGLLIFSDQMEHFIAPRKGRNHVLRLIRDLLAARPSQRGTDISAALKTVSRLVKRRSIIFFLSDFLAPAQSYTHELLVTSRRHDLIAVVMSDPLEQVWPNAGLVGLRDAETDVVRWVDTASQTWRTQFEQRARQFQQQRDAVLMRAGVDRIALPVDGDYVRSLTGFFRERVRRIRR